ncbi:MAG TPA: hypothetical protein VFX65_14135 [Candidatus Limnocylindrales bacterium]|nr:hypothetical protein [Candidatus Limnocylindrales bacterium]
MAPPAREQWGRRSPYVVLVVAVMLVIAGQLAEDLADSEPLQLLAPLSAVRRWTLIVAVGYMLTISLVIDRLVLQSLTALDRLVKIRPERFRDYTDRMRRPGPGPDLAMLAASGLLVALLFLGLRSSLPIDDGVTNAEVFLPTHGLAAALVLVEYTLVGWAVLTLVWTTIRRARALGELSREPLHVDVFDTSNVLPLGNIALATALAPAGVIVILLLGLGAPSEPISWALLVLVSLASLLALLLPLRGIHGQMEGAKDRAISDINQRLRKSYDELRDSGTASPEAMGNLRNRVGTLIDLRRTVGEMTTWPFRDTIAFGRAVLIALAPLIYTVINELIKIFVINPLER